TKYKGKRPSAHKPQTKPSRPQPEAKSPKQPTKAKQKNKRRSARRIPHAKPERSVARGPQAKRQQQPIKLAPKGKLRIAIVGGNEEVGRNCTMLEYENDIIFIDMGIQFPEENMPGIDYVIPNMKYVKGKESNIRGVSITHGHLDHIGGVHHVLPEIGNPPVYALPMAAGMIKKKQEDFQGRSVDVKQVKASDVLQLGKFRISFLHLNHSIPDAVGIIIDTPEGRIVHTGDWKFDFHPSGTTPADFGKIAKVGNDGVMALLSDSTSSIHPGHQISEKEIGKNLEQLIQNVKGRIILGTFSSQLSRVKQIIEIAEKHGRKIAIDGYSMKTNVEIAKQLGYLKFQQSTIITPEQMDKYPKHKVMLICTGAQGEQRAALMRIANNEHRSIRLIPGDTVIFSSSVVPGNEKAVERLRDILARRRVKTIDFKMLDIHAGGHAKAEDIKLMISLMQPKYYVPIEGNTYLLVANAKIAESLGYSEDKNIFIPDNGQIMEFTKGEGKLTQEKIPTDYVFVDGLGVGDVSQVVLRDRQLLAEDGMVVVIVQVERKTGKLHGSPDIISRGFVYMKENKALIEAVRIRAKNIVTDRNPSSQADSDYIRNRLRNDLGTFLFKKTERRPMVLPVVIEV
ncbi:MAG: ribonuclease J, partial [Candidatus Uhrbacteria bacterium]